MKILIFLNPKHQLTQPQIEQLAGHEIYHVKDVAPELSDFLKNCPDDPSMLDLNAMRSHHLFNLYDAVILPFGSPAFQFYLGAMLGFRNDPTFYDKFYFAHSEEKSIETVSENGEVLKKSHFVHTRFFNLRNATL